MKNTILYLSIVTIVLIGCGKDETINNTIVTNDSSIITNSIAKDNTLKEVVKSFRTYQIKVITDKTLNEDAVSNDTFAVYGEVDGENTAALLKLNSNYPIGTKITVKVFDRDSKKLVGESEPVTYSGGVVNFGVVELD